MFSSGEFKWKIICSLEKKRKKKVSDTFPVQDGELTHAFNLHSLLSLIKMTVGVFVKLQGWRKWEQQNFGNGKTAEHVRIDVADLRKLSLKLAGEGATDSLAYVETPPFPQPRTWCHQMPLGIGAKVGIKEKSCLKAGFGSN